MIKRLSVLLLFCAQPLLAQTTLTAGWLYWQAEQNGLDYTTQPVSIFTTTNFAEGDLVAPDSHWKSGFYLNADYSHQTSPWTVGARVTHYNGSADDTKTAGPTEGIFPTLSFAPDTLATDYATSAQTNWSLSTTLLDLNGSQEWFLNDRLTIRQSFAIRNVWISQHLSATYQGATFAAGPDTVKLRSSFYGIGPKLGFTPIYQLNNQLNMYAGAACTLLYGMFHVNQREFFLSTQRAALNKSPRGTRWNIDLNAGFSWFSPMGYSIDLGFDFLYFSKQYAFKHGPRFSLQHQNKYLLLYGIHLSAGMQF